MFNENAYQARSTRARKRRLKFTLSGQRLPKEDSFDVFRRHYSSILCILMYSVFSAISYPESSGFLVSGGDAGRDSGTGGGGGELSIFPIGMARPMSMAIVTSRAFSPGKFK